MGFAFERLSIPDLILIHPRVLPDDRGFFLETYKKSEFVENGVEGDFVQDNHSSSSRAVLRGLHYQLPPHAQGKLVRVVYGKVWDVAVDLRRDSPTFGKWLGVELSSDDMSMFWIPPGFAHGFVSLVDSTQFLYKCTAEYDKSSERGIRWDDPDLGIAWPMGDVLVSSKDAGLPLFREADIF